MHFLKNDEISKLAHGELKDLFFKVRSAIQFAKRKKTNAKELEIYYCYVSRELQNRAVIKNNIKN
jgi:hypothetical protein